jgi:hypothetical protein
MTRLLLNRFLLFTYNPIEAVDPMNRPVTVDIINNFRPSGSISRLSSVYPLAWEFWKLGHPNYFRLSSQQGTRTSCFVADSDSAFGNKGLLRSLNFQHVMR